MEFIFWTPVLFIIFAMVGLLMYKFSEAIAPPLTDVGNKLHSYACGDTKRFPELTKAESSFHLFDIAVFFTIVDLSVMMIATISPEANLNVVLLYFGIMVLTLVILFEKRVGMYRKHIANLKCGC